MHNHVDILYKNVFFCISLVPEDGLCKSKCVGKITANKQMVVSQHSAISWYRQNITYIYIYVIN